MHFNHVQLAARSFACSGPQKRKMQWGWFECSGPGFKSSCFGRCCILLIVAVCDTLSVQLWCIFGRWMMPSSTPLFVWRRGNKVLCVLVWATSLAWRMHHAPWTGNPPFEFWKIVKGFTFTATAGDH